MIELGNISRILIFTVQKLPRNTTKLNDAKISHFNVMVVLSDTKYLG